MAIRVLVCDGCPFTRNGLSTALAGTDVEVVGQAADVGAAVSAAATTDPDVVLVDIELPPSGGLEAIRQLLVPSDQGRPAVVLLAAHPSWQHALAALREGASAVLCTELSAADLVRSVQVVAAGGVVVSAVLLHELLAEVLPYVPHLTLDPAEAIERLTAREREVLALVCRGDSNAQIARRFVVTESTVKAHVSHLLTKLGCQSRSQAAALARQRGLDRPTDASRGEGG